MWTRHASSKQEAISLFYMWYALRDNNMNNKSMNDDICSIILGIFFFLGLLSFFVYICFSSDVNASSVFDGWVPDYP